MNRTSAQKFLWHKYEKKQSPPWGSFCNTDNPVSWDSCDNKLENNFQAPHYKYTTVPPGCDDPSPVDNYMYPDHLNLLRHASQSEEAVTLYATISGMGVDEGCHDVQNNPLKLLLLRELGDFVHCAVSEGTIRQLLPDLLH
jgi:hypothetical protein